MRVLSRNNEPHWLPCLIKLSYMNIYYFIVSQGLVKLFPDWVLQLSEFTEEGQYDNIQLQGWKLKTTFCKWTASVNLYNEKISKQVGQILDLHTLASFYKQQT